MSNKIVQTINGKKVTKRPTECYNIEEYDLDNIVFCDPRKVPIPGGLFMYKINMLCKYAKRDAKKNIIYDSNGKIVVDDNTIGKCAFVFPKMFSFGVSENIMNGKLDGYQMSFVLHDREADGGAKENQLKIIDELKNFIERAKKHLVSIRKQIGKPDCDQVRDFKNLNKLLYQKMGDNGEPAPDSPPTLSAKLEFYKEREEGGVVKPSRMVTKFYEVDDDGEPVLDEEDNPTQVNPLNYLSVKSGDNKSFTLCNVFPMLDFDCVNIGVKESVSVVMHEAGVKKIEREARGSLMFGNRPVSYKRISAVVNDDETEETQTNEVVEKTETLELNDDEDDDETPVREPTPPPVEEKKKKTLRKKKGDE